MKLFVTQLAMLQQTKIKYQEEEKDFSFFSSVILEIFCHNEQF